MDPFSSCDTLVRDQDEDRWLSARYARPEDRRRLIALTAVHVEIARVPAQVREPPLGEIRLQWWREGLAAISASQPPPHPSLQALAAADLPGSALGALGAAIDARARLLYGDPFTSAEDFAGWLAASEAWLAAAGARVLAGETGFDAGAVEAAALAYGLARLGPRLGENLYTDVCAEAARQRASARSSGPFPAAIMPAIAHLALAPAYLRKTGPGPVGRRLAIFGAVVRGRI